ncbi:hypothetical protein SAMN05216344_1128 [Polaromonas sp. OV174]|uniref:hypothetical protein n=1 Tax=Polaromonas sp. OV174 TaxID=1855300 RepID=UPI0008EE88B3|nr:hypothetical protein [Polaromonas sp. OV174]SFC23867.1 hypothetical protein SAMN05216344_1128 [Polaromonas sp. OV174]
MTLAELSAQLRLLLDETQEAHPLLCEGSPFDCNVAIVGINPATTTQFWPYWTDSLGMDRTAWIDAYKTKHRKFNRSRAALERFIPQIKANVVEVNAYARQSRRFADLQRQHRTSSAMEFLLSAIRPRVIVYAGAAALNAGERLTPAWHPVVIPARHFIYWGKQYESELAVLVNHALAHAQDSTSREI